MTKYTPQIKLTQTAEQLERVTLDQMPVALVCRCKGEEFKLTGEGSAWRGLRGMVIIDGPMVTGYSNGNHCQNLEVLERLDGQPLPACKGPETWGDAVAGDVWRGNDEEGLLVWRLGHCFQVAQDEEITTISDGDMNDNMETYIYLGRCDPLNPGIRFEEVE